MKSMTGFGSSRGRLKDLELEVHVKSVNGRFLELRFHLPKEYAPFENDFREAFADWTRGTVDIYLHRKAHAQTVAPGRLRVDQAKRWARDLGALAKAAGINTQLTVRDLLLLPGVLETQDRVSLEKGEIKWATQQVKQASQKAEAFRKREGQMLKKEITNLLKMLEKGVHSMAGWREEALKGAEQRLKSRMSHMESEKIEASRLAVETALLLDKMDVHEEVVRLREHIASCRNLVQDGEARGKKLDFYCQELLREVNTIGSKSQLSKLTQVVVEAKSVIEKFREQVQNIE